MAARHRTVISCILALVALPFCYAAAPRGVDPALASHYTGADGKFQCLDGSKIIPFSQVNDGYCDCLDGTDEPGTSACANGKFYCANLGSEPVRLNSSFVDDGVCDCCDGSDEGPNVCSNNCKDMAEAALQALQTQLNDYEQGLQIRSRYIKNAAGLRRDWTARLEELELQIGPLEAKSKRAADARSRLQKQLEALDARKEALEEAVKAAEPTPEPEEPAEEAVVAEENGEEQQIDDEEEEEESAEELAKRVASQWIPDANKDSGGDDDNDDAELSEEDIRAFDEAEDDTAFEDDEEGDLVDEAEEPHGSSSGDDDSTKEEEEDVEIGSIDLGIIESFRFWFSGLVAKILNKPANAAELERLRSAVEAMRKRVEKASVKANGAEDTLTTTRLERDDLVKKLDESYGTDNVYAVLVDKCIEANVDKYTYKVCPFKKSEQVENGRGTNLGNWEGFDESAEHMLFEHGEGCWQGPSRSIKVRLHCGSSEVLSKVAEPSRCEYTADMTTPAACTEDGVAVLRAAVEAKEALLALATSATPKDEL